MSQFKRRDVLKIGALAAAGLGFPAILRAQSKEIVILGLWDQTGAFADVGPLNDRGMKMALEERDMKILGRPIKYITRDGGTQAGTSTRRTEEAVDAEGAKFVVGPWSSGVALAVSEVAKRKKVVHLFSGGTEDISGGRCQSEGQGSRKDRDKRFHTVDTPSGLSLRHRYHAGMRFLTSEYFH